MRFPGKINVHKRVRRTAAYKRLSQGPYYIRVNCISCSENIIDRATRVLIYIRNYLKRLEELTPSMSTDGITGRHYNNSFTPIRYSCDIMISALVKNN